MAQESIREGGGPSCWWCAARGCARKRDCWYNDHARASERASVRVVWGSEQVEGVMRRRRRAGGRRQARRRARRERERRIFSYSRLPA